MWYGLVNFSQYEQAGIGCSSKSVQKSHVRSYQCTGFFFFFFFFLFFWISSSYTLLCGYPCLLHKFPYFLLNVLKAFSNYKMWFFSWGQLVYSETMFICINWSRKWRILSQMLLTFACSKSVFGFEWSWFQLWIFLVAQLVKNLPAMQETLVRFPR